MHQDGILIITKWIVMVDLSWEIRNCAVYGLQLPSTSATIIIVNQRVVCIMHCFHKPDPHLVLKPSTYWMSILSQWRMKLWFLLMEASCCPHLWLGRSVLVLPLLSFFALFGARTRTATNAQQVEILWLLNTILFRQNSTTLFLCVILMDCSNIVVAIQRPLQRPLEKLWYFRENHELYKKSWC